MAQTAKQVIVLNEGYYNWSTQTQVVPVTLGAYDVALKTYTSFDTIPAAQFASDVIIDDNYIYAATSVGIYKYNKNSKQFVTNNTATGIRKMCVWNNQLLVSRGDIGLNNYFFQAYDKNTLALIYELDVTNGPAYSTEGISVVGDSCYIALNNGFNFPNYTGYIGVIYLPTATYVRQFDLGPIGLNPDYFAIKNGVIHTLNNRDFTNASISTYELATGQLATTDLQISSGCGTSVLAGTEILYQVMGATTLQKFSLSSQSTYDSLLINKPVYGLAHEDVANLIYAGETDFVSTGQVFIYNMAGLALDSFMVGVSPGNMVIDYNSTSGIAENVSQLNVYPNPATNQIYLGNQKPASYQILNVTGIKVAEGVALPQANINISNLSNGIYFLKTQSGTYKFNKQ